MSSLKIIVKIDGAFVTGVEHNIVSHSTYEEYNVSSNEEGVSLIELPTDVYTITSTYVKENIVYDSQINTIAVKSPTESFINVLNVELSSCGDTVLLDKTCKYFHHEPYMTPNNYDLYFDYNNIPVNIITESPSELHKRLQSCLPLDKILHLNLDTQNEEHGNNIHINSNVFVNYNSRIINSNEDNIFNPKIICNWNDDMLLDYMFEMQRYELENGLKNKAEQLQIPYTIDEEEINSIINESYYSSGDDVLEQELYNLFNVSLDIMNLSSETIIEIGMNNTPDYENYSDVELSINGSDYITDVRDTFISESLIILDKIPSDFHTDISVDLYEDNVLIFANLILDVSNGFVNSLEESYGIGYFKGVLNAVDTEEFMFEDVNGIQYEEGVLTARDELDFDYVLSVFSTPENYDKVNLHIYKTRQDNSILDYELKNYNIDFTEYRFYTCQNCGKVVYSDTAVVECEDCMGTDMLISDVPYTVVFEDYANNYYVKEKLKLL